MRLGPDPLVLRSRPVPSYRRVAHLLGSPFVEFASNIDGGVEVGYGCGHGLHEAVGDWCGHGLALLFVLRNIADLGGLLGVMVGDAQ